MGKLKFGHLNQTNGLKEILETNIPLLRQELTKSHLISLEAISVNLFKVKHGTSVFMVFNMQHLILRLIQSTYSRL